MNERRTILIRYDEIGLKGKNRDQFINRLVKNIQLQMKDLAGLKFKVASNVVGSAVRGCFRSGAGQKCAGGGGRCAVSVPRGPPSVPFCAQPWPA